SDTGIITLKDLTEVQKVFEQMQRYFIDDNITKRQLIDGAIAGGVSSLKDRYSRYVPPQESREVTEDLEGFYGGVGIMVEPIQDQKGALLTQVFKTGPADEVGMNAGDIITHVEDQDVTEMFLYDIVAKIKGPVDTKVKVTVYRQAIGDSLDFELTRKNVKYPSVFESKILEGTDGIGYIQLVNFNNETTKDTQKAVDDLLEQGMKSLVLDLKQNTGGSFAAAIEIADIFVGDGVMVYTEDRDNTLQEYPPQGKGDGGKKLGIPLVVLVDQYSASASEILAGAIKDHKVGTLIGRDTFGKGVVQSVIPQTAGGILLLTISKYLTPDKNDINQIGIKPDIHAEIDPETTNDPFLKEKYTRMLELRDESREITTELVEYLKGYNFPLEVAKQYLSTGELLDGAYLVTDEEKTDAE
ncbi:MAG: S41 family peptidase, partial [bacterium]